MQTMTPPFLGQVRLISPRLGQQAGDEKFKFVVTVLDSNGNPIPNALVTFKNAQISGGWGAGDYTDASGVVVMDLPWDIDLNDFLEIAAKIGEHDSLGTPMGEEKAVAVQVRDQSFEFFFDVAPVVEEEPPVVETNGGSEGKDPVPEPAADGIPVNTILLGVVGIGTLLILGSKLAK